MRWQQLNLPLIAVSVLAGVAFLFSAQVLYNKYTWQEPLKKYFDSNTAISSYRIENNRGYCDIYIEVYPQANLASVYKEVKQKAGKILANKKKFNIYLVDSRDELLKEIWYNCQYAVYQAQQCGTYQDMAKVVGYEAAVNGVEAKIFIDNDYIYLRLRKGDRTLDEIIPRLGNNNSTAVQGHMYGSGSGVQRS